MQEICVCVEAQLPCAQFEMSPEGEFLYLSASPFFGERPSTRASRVNRLMAHWRKAKAAPLPCASAKPVAGSNGLLNEWERCDKASAILFEEMVDRLELAASSETSRSKKAMFIFDNWLSEQVGQQSLYPYVRLLIPSLDNGRRNFGLKTKMLAKIFVDVWFLQSSADGEKLRYFAGDAEARQNFGGSDLSAAVEEVAKDRSALPRGTQTIGEVHAFLDTVVQAQSTLAYTKIFRDAKMKFSAREIKWITRVIECNLKIGVTDKLIFGELHPLANDRYSACCDLRRVCADFAHKSGPLFLAAAQGLSQQDTDVEPGHPFKPHLAHGHMRDGDQATTIEAKSMRVGKLGSSTEARAKAFAPFVIDDKLDGERVLCHKAGSELSYWTRNAKDYLKEYAPPLSGPIQRRLEGLGDLILDGEAIAVNRETGRMEPLGSIAPVRHIEARRHKLRAEGKDPDCEENREELLRGVKLGDGFGNDFTDAQPLLDACIEYVVFDIVHLAEPTTGCTEATRRVLGTHSETGEPLQPGSLRSLPLRERRFILERLLALHEGGAEAHRLRMVPHEVVDDAKLSAKQRRDTLQKYFEDIVQKGGEGCVCKNLLSPYVLGQKSHTLGYWAKLKPDYDPASAQVPYLDCVIVAGYWSEATPKSKYRYGTLSQFVVAVREESRTLETKALYTVGRVATGFDTLQLAALHAKIGEDNWVPFDSKNPPKYLENWKYKAEDRPDRVIKDVTRSVVLQVKANELVQSSQYAIDFTWRFPRVERVRLDKAWDDSDTVVHARALFKAPRSAAPDSSKKRGAADDASKRKPKKEARLAPGVRRDNELDASRIRQLADSDTPKIFDRERETFVVLPNARAESFTAADGSSSPTLAFTAVAELIASLGGRVLASVPTKGSDVVSNEHLAPTVTLVGAPGRDEMHVKSHENIGKYSVLDARWFVRCAAAKQRLPLAPRDYVIASTLDAERLRRTHEGTWGVHLTEKTTGAELKASYEAARDARAAGRAQNLYDDQDIDPASLAATLAKVVARCKTPSRLFYGLTVLARGAAEPLGMRMRYLSASLSPTLVPGVTHVLAKNAADVADLRALAAADPASFAGLRFVNRKWLADSTAQGRVIDPPNPLEHAPSPTRYIPPPNPEDLEYD